MNRNMANSLFCFKKNKQKKKPQYLQRGLHSSFHTNPLHYAIQCHKRVPKLSPECNGCAIKWCFQKNMCHSLNIQILPKNVLICKWAVSLASYTSYSAAAGGVWLNHWWLFIIPLMVLQWWVCKLTHKKNQTTNMVLIRSTVIIKK